MDWKGGLKKGAKWTGGAVGTGYLLTLMWGEIKDERLAREAGLQALSNSLTASLAARDALNLAEHHELRREHIQAVKETNSRLGNMEGMMRALLRAQRGPSMEPASRFGRQQKQTARRDG